MRVRKLCSVAHQAAGFGIGAQGIDGWYGVARRQRDELHPTVDEEGVGMDHKCVGPLLQKARKGRVNLGSSAGREELDLWTNSRRRGFDIFLQGFSSRIFGLTSTAKRVAVGNSSCKRPSRLATSSLLLALTPVMLPPGRLRLATRPSWTGSKPRLKTIGIVVVAALAASAAAELPGVAMTATRRRTRSATNSGIRERSFCAQRYSIVTF